MAVFVCREGGTLGQQPRGLTAFWVYKNHLVCLLKRTPHSDYSSGLGPENLHFNKYTS